MFHLPLLLTEDPSLWNSLMQLLGSKRIHTTAYHPIANGLIERLHCQLKAALKTYHSPAQYPWYYWVSTQHACMHALMEDINCSAVKLVYGTTLRVPGEFFDNSKADATIEPSNYVQTLKLVVSSPHPAPNRRGKGLGTGQRFFGCASSVLFSGKPIRSQP